MKSQRVCVIGPKDPMAMSGLGFDVGPLIDTLTQAGTKYYEAGVARRALEREQKAAALAELEAQRRQIALGQGGIGGMGLALLLGGMFFLLSRRR